MYNKNDELQITITDQGTNGEGIGKVDGYTLFVKDTVIGDECLVKVIKAKKNYGFARLIEVIKPSEYRVEPRCKVARSCGGCQLQAMSYAKQLEFKSNKVLNNLKRIGGIDLSNVEVEPIIGMDEPFFYRNKAQFPVGRNKDGEICYGFYAGRTHSIIENDGCDLSLRVDGKNVCKDIMDIVIRFMNDYGIEPYDEKTRHGLVRHVLIRIGHKTKQIMVCLVVNGNELPHSNELVGRLSGINNMATVAVNINKEAGNVIMGLNTNTLAGPGFIEDYIGDVKFRISPLSFFQVNPTQTEKLYGKALEYAGLTGKETVWDMYCGIGTISLFLAQSAGKVMGVEIVPDAIEDAKLNARLNGIENAEFMCGAAEKVVPEFFEKNSRGEDLCKPDVVVVDPPRKGCDSKLLETIVLMNPKSIVYVSCDSATLARDIAWLEANNYSLKKITPCDMFSQTIHVETVALLSKNL